MAMGRGQFDRAEDLFATYRYIAADQANPHDSMGELLMLTGRYEEARVELERALEIRDDFCPAWRHLVETALLQGDLAAAREAAEGTAQRSDCPPEAIADTRCSLALWERVVEDDWAGVRDAAESTCRTTAEATRGPDEFGWVSGEALVFAQRAALTTGDLAAGRQLLEETRAFSDRLVERSTTHRVDDGFAGLVAHLEGAQALAEGRARDAAQEFARADELFAYWGQGEINTFKLFNRVNLAAAQEAAGDSAAAHATLRELDAVNPKFARSHGDVDWSLGTVPRTPPGTEEGPFTLGSDRRGER
jgi:tetratricopeptide (TPR) repeat protein